MDDREQLIQRSQGMMAWHAEKNPEYVVNRKLEVGRWLLRVQWRSRDNAWGRFGGGWNWALGFRIGGSTLLIDLILLSIILRRRKRN